jgi:hypothetical protein
MRLHSPAAWAGFKFISFRREEMAAGMLKWQKDTIHNSLVDLVDHNGTFFS